MTPAPLYTQQVGRESLSQYRVVPGFYVIVSLASVLTTHQSQPMSNTVYLDVLERNRLS